MTRRPPQLERQKNYMLDTLELLVELSNPSLVLINKNVFTDDDNDKIVTDAGAEIHRS